MPLFCNRPTQQSTLRVKYLSRFDEFNNVLQDTVQVFIRKSWGINYLGPFKGFEAHYHGQKSWWNFC